MGKLFPLIGEFYVGEIAQNESCRLRFVTQKQSCGFVEECSSEHGAALDPGNDCPLEIASKRHGYHLFRFLPYLRPGRIILDTALAANLRVVRRTNSGAFRFDRVFTSLSR